MFGVHWIPTNRGSLGSKTDAQIIAEWAPSFVKIVCIDEKPPYLEDVPTNAMIVIRNHPMSELYDERGLPLATPAPPADYWQAWDSLPRKAEPSGRPYVIRPPLTAVVPIGETEPPATPRTAEQVGQEHAAACRRMALYCESRGVARSRLLFEGLNEPHLWADEPPAAVARYYRAFLIGLHNDGLRGVVGNFGVGWPGNGGVQDAPVEWGFFEPVIREFRTGDYLGLHEYWALNGPEENWRWWGGRFTQCPFQVPILMTECGIDTGVTGQWYGGWRDLPGGSEDEKARRYADELVRYVRRCQADGRVKAVFSFTYDIGSIHWVKFDIRSEVFLREFFAVKDQAPDQTPFREWAWREGKDSQCIWLNPDAALQKRILADGFTPLGNEFAAKYEDANLVCQLAGRLDSKVERVYYCVYGQWDTVLYEEYAG